MNLNKRLYEVRHLLSKTRKEIGRRYELIPHINNYIAVWNDPLKNPGMPLRGFEEIKNIFMPGQLGAIIPMDHPYSELVINTWYKPVRNQLVNWLS